MHGGLDVTGTVKLECNAAPGSITVALSSSKPNVANPNVSNLVFAPGSDTNTFTITTTSVIAPTIAKISASSGGVVKTKKLAVNP